jgi:hypothetical protein
MAGAGAKSGSSGTRKRRKISQISVHRNLILMGIDLCLSHVFTSKVWCSKQCREQQNDAQIHQKFLVCRGFRRVTAPRNFFSRFSGSFRFVPVRSGSFRFVPVHDKSSFWFVPARTAVIWTRFQIFPHQILVLIIVFYDSKLQKCIEISPRYIHSVFIDSCMYVLRQ